MKKSKGKKILSRFMSGFLSAALALSLTPISALTAYAADGSDNEAQEQSVEPLDNEQSEADGSSQSSVSQNNAEDDTATESGKNDAATSKAVRAANAVSTLAANYDDTGTNWTLKAYYVGEKDPNHVDRNTDKYKVKYQIQFDVSENTKTGNVKLKVPAVLFKDRNGKDILPADSDIAAPKGTPQKPYTSNEDTYFNWYYETGDDGVKYIVFWNYKDIPSGTNNSIQVLYKNISLMDTIDGTEWSFPVSAEVTKDDGTVEKDQTKDLTGTVDSKVLLKSVSKKPYSRSGSMITPGLYTPGQVESYINGSIPSKFSGAAFDDYYFVVWAVDYTAEATQPWNLVVKDTSTAGNTAKGEVVGFTKRAGDSVSYDAKASFDSNGQATVVRTSKVENVSSSIYVVTAYPKNKVPEGTLLKNNVSLTMVPADGKDKDQTKSAKAEWTSVDFKWVYSGDIIGVKKSANPKKSDAWLTLYEKTKQDTAGLNYTTNGVCNGAIFTHYGAHVGNSESGSSALPVPAGKSIGDYAEGTYYEMTATDDVVYAYVNGKRTLLTGDDYYFKKVTFNRTDKACDPFETKTAKPEAPAGIDQTMKVYAMLSNPGTGMKADAAGWYEIGSAKWDDSGKVSYSFTDEQVAMQPYKVKAVYNSVNDTVCNINVELCIKKDSPVMKKILEDNPGLTQMQFENISGVAGRNFSKENAAGTWFHDRTLSGKGVNYMQYADEPTLADQTTAAHGVIIMRDAATTTVTALEEHAESYKDVSTENDPQNNRGLATYRLTAFEGYRVSSKSVVDSLRTAGVKAPKRQEVVFYDLLPTGIKYNAARKVTAGRLVNLANSSYRKYSKAWDATGVSVKVDPDKDVIENYNDTGRTMVVFHVSYTGADSSVYSDNMWETGFGIEFQAYYDWKDLGLSQVESNIAAYMTGSGEKTELFGKKDAEVFKDNGVYPQSLSADYKAFGSGDLDKNGVTDRYTVMYANAIIDDDLATASSSTIEKKVRADDDVFNKYGKTAEVRMNDGYTYEYILTNTSQNPLENIVVYDSIENAESRAQTQGETVFDGPQTWSGTVKSLDLQTLDKLGIAYTVYYNESEQDLDHGQNRAGSTLTTANGWYDADAWKKAGKTEKDIASFAIKLADDFSLAAGDSFSFVCHMTAPGKVADNSVKNYTYNNSAYYSVSNGSRGELVVGNTVRVELADYDKLEVVKTLDDSAYLPSSAKQESFGFVLKDKNGSPIANRSYVLYEKDADGIWQQMPLIPRSTDAAGAFYIKADQKAVFLKVVDAESCKVTESESAFWKPTAKMAKIDGGTQVLFVNTFAPPLYVSKKLTALPSDVSASDQHFTMVLKDAGGNPVGNATYYVVKKATLGSDPQYVYDENGDKITGRTNEKGEFTIDGNQTVMFNPGKSGETFEVAETDAGDDFICESPNATLKLKDVGASAAIENIYRYKSLYLTKTIRSQEPSACTQKFSFKITDENGDPVEGLTWTVINAEGKAVEPAISGKTGTDGIVTAAIAGSDRRLKIDGLVAKQTYKVVEQPTGTDAYDIVDGTATVYAPLRSEYVTAKVVNKYMLRDLSVSKTVLVHDFESKDTVSALFGKYFTMTLYKKTADGSWKTCPNIECTIDGFKGLTDSNGQFYLYNRQTAVFTEIGREGEEFRIVETQDSDFPQISPVDKEEGAVVELTDKGASASIINGERGLVAIGKKYTATEGDEDATAVADAWNCLRVKNASVFGQPGIGSTGIGYTTGVSELDALIKEDSRVALSLTIENADGSTQPYPASDTKVYVIDLGSGKATVKTWKQGSTIDVLPTEIVVVPDLPDGTKFVLSEADADKTKLFDLSDKELEAYGINKENSMLTSSLKTPVTGVAGIDGNVVVENELKTTPVKSRIFKAMSDDSSDIPSGAKISFRVEKKGEDGGWYPARGVKYFTCSYGSLDGKSSVSDEKWTGIESKTAVDGIISVEKSDKGLPELRFPDIDIKLNPDSSAAAGTYRLVEVSSDTDKAWGILTGYASSDNDYPTVGDTDRHTTDAFGENLDIIVNSNDGGGKLKVEKTVPEDSDPDDTLFTFVLKHITSTTDKIGKIDVTSDGDAPGDGESVDTSDAEPYTLTRDDVADGVDLPDGTHVTLNSGDVSIPEYIVKDGKVYRIISIARAAFAGFTSLTSITIPDSVIRIRENAFNSCASLKSVTIPDSVTSIEDYVFTDCTALKSVTIPDSVTVIGYRAFSGCTALESVTIPDSVTSIGDYAFEDCTALKSVTIPDSVTRIGGRAFRNCTSLANVTIPDSVTEIGWFVFSGCTSLASVTIPDSVTSIGKYAFSGCTSLASITIPDSVTKIGWFAFNECTALTSVTIPDSVTEIGQDAFYGCKALASITIPDSVTSIGEGAFYDCGTLYYSGSATGSPWGAKEVISGYTLTADDVKKTGVDLPDGTHVTLNSGNVEIPELIVKDGKTYQVTGIGDNAFAWCSTVTGITIPDSVKTIGQDAFYQTAVKKLVIPDSVTEIGDNACERMLALESVALPETLESIGAYAFGECSKLANVIIPDSVTSIGEDAFFMCGTLYYSGSAAGAPWGAVAREEIPQYTLASSDVKNGVDLPDGTHMVLNSGDVSIPEYIVKDGLPYQITEIGEYAFEGCDALKSVTIPDSVTEIGHKAFEGCTSLESVIIPDSVTKIRDNAFIDCTSLESVTIPDSVTVIGDWAFSGCKALASVTIPDSVDEIGEGAFYGCEALASVTIPDSVTSIGNYAFEGCASLINITIPNLVTSIGALTFEGCTSLVNIGVPDSVTSIGSGAFSGCTSLESVALPETLKSIGASAFGECYNLGNILIPDSVTKIGWFAFKDCDILYYNGSATGAPWGATMVLSKAETSKDLPSSTIENPSDIISSELGTNIDYKIYDKDTGKLIGEGNTGETGEIILKANQYAVLDVPNGTSWEVSEKVPSGWTMTGLTAQNGVVSGNTAIFDGIVGEKSSYYGDYWNGYLISDDDLANGVDLPDGTHMALDGSNVKLPEYIVKNGEVYRVSGLGLNRGTYTDESSSVKSTVVTPADCTHDGISTCTVDLSGKVYTWTSIAKALGHDYQVTEIMKEPTDTAPGIRKTVCSRCGKTVYERYYSDSSKPVEQIDAETAENEAVPTVTYDYATNGGTSASLSSSTVASGEQADLTPTASRKGYDFIGWNTDPEAETALSSYEIPNHDVTLYAIYKISNYSITYDLNGGTLSGQKTSYTVEDDSYTLPQPTRTGYTFTGWTEARSGNAGLTAIINKGSTGNKSYTANWRANELTIRYHLNGGTAITSDPCFTNSDPCRTGTYAYGDTMSKYSVADATSTRAQRVGYHLDTAAYNTKADGTGTKVPYNESAEMSVQDYAKKYGKDLSNGDQTLDIYIVWVKNTLTIRYHANGGTVVSGNDAGFTSGDPCKTQTVTYGANWAKSSLWSPGSTRIKRTGYHATLDYNTKADGTGTKVPDNESADMTIQAWAKKYGKDITYSNQTIDVYVMWVKN